jgi:hypothetical protein
MFYSSTYKINGTVKVPVLYITKYRYSVEYLCGILINSSLQ